MKLSDLQADEIKTVKASEPSAPKSMKLSDLSDDDVSSPKSEVTKTESGIRGAAQGATLGFADELTGGVEALKDAITSDVYGLSDVPEQYSKHRDESRAAYKASQEANPLSYGAGEFAGALALPAGSIGAAKNAGLLTRLIAGTASGAAMGGIGSLGAAETLDSNTLKDAAKDAAIGAGVGGAITGGAAALGKAGSKFINKYEGTRDLAKVFNAAKSGESIIGEKAANKASQDVANTAEDYIKTLTGKKKAASGLYEEAKALQSSQSNIPALSQVQNLQSELATMGKNAPLASQEKSISDVQDLLNRLVGKEETTTARYAPEAIVAKTPSLTAEEKALESTSKAMTKNQIEQDLLLNQRADEISERLGVDRDVIYNTLKERYPSFKAAEAGPEMLSRSQPTAGLTGREAMVAQAEGLPNVVTPIGKEKSTESLFTPIKRIEETNTQFTKPAVDANEIVSRVQTLKDLASNAGTQYERDAYNKAIEGLQAIIPDNGSAIAYDKASNAYKQSSDLLAKAGLDFGYDASHSGKLGFQQAQKNVGNEIRNYKPGKSQKTRIDDVLDQLSQTDPQKSEQLRSQIQSAQDAARIAGASVERSGLSGGGIRQLTAETTRAATLGTADIIGKIASAPKKIGTYVAEQGKAIYNASPESLQQLASSLTAKGSPYAAKLQSAASQSDRSRKALLFVLQQDPGFREALRGEENGQ